MFKFLNNAEHPRFEVIMKSDTCYKIYDNKDQKFLGTSYQDRETAFNAFDNVIKLFCIQVHKKSEKYVNVD